VGLLEGVGGSDLLLELEEHLLLLLEGHRGDEVLRGQLLEHLVSLAGILPTFLQR